MKRFTVFLMTALLLFCLCACKSPAPSDDGQPPEQDGGGESPAVVQLTGFEKDGDIYGVCAAGDNQVAVLFEAPFDDPDPYVYAYRQHLALFDIETNSVVREITLTDNRRENLLGVRTGGEVLTYSYDTGELRFYTSELSPDRAVSLPETWGMWNMIFDREGDRFICPVKNELYEMTMDGTQSLIVSVDEDYVISAFDPHSGLMIYGKKDAETNMIREFHVYDTAEQSDLLTEQANTPDFRVHDGCPLICSRSVLPEKDRKSIHEHSVITLYSADLQSAKGYDIGKNSIFEWADGSRYAYGVYYDLGEESGIGGESADIVFYDLETGTKADSTVDGEGVYDTHYCFFPGTGRCLVATVGGRNNEELNSAGLIRFYLVDPSGLDYSESLAETAPEVGDNIREQAEKNRQVLRDIADELENDLHVTVLFGDDCLNVDLHPAYTFISTDGGADDNPIYISRMLSYIREYLSTYPEGFLERFRYIFDYEEEGGLRFLLVQDLVNQDFTSFSAGGMCYRHDPWINVVLDINEPITTVPHEMWHAVEERIFADNMEAFDLEKWMELNPPGFEYTNNLDHYEENSERWENYFYLTGDESYFARRYSTESPHEDRATLIELLYGISSEDGTSYAEIVSGFPHLKAKLDYMAEQVKATFGMVYWEDTP